MASDPREALRGGGDQLRPAGLIDSDGVGVGEVEAWCVVAHSPQQGILVVVAHVVVVTVLWTRVDEGRKG